MNAQEAAAGNEPAAFLRRHGLKAMAAEYEAQALAHDARSFEERWAAMVALERTAKADRALARALKASGLPSAGVAVEEAIVSSARNLHPHSLEALAEGLWVKKGRNLIVHGETGRGKTWLVQALATSAVRHGLTVTYTRVSHFLDEIGQATTTELMKRFQKRLARVDLLVLDNWADDLMTERDVSDLREVLLQRLDASKPRSIAIASASPIEQWTGWLLGGHSAMGLVDRLQHSSHVVALTGPSMRGRGPPR